MSNELQEFAAVLAGMPRLAVLTGAGVSTASGIPHYRDRDGMWRHAEPIQFQEFMHSEAARRRYWARSFFGWQNFAKAAPNPVHRAFASLERSGRIDTLITQNVDGLHRRAGSRSVIDLHGDLARVICMACNTRSARSDWQHRLANGNSGWTAQVASFRPDGDAELAGAASDEFEVPGCVHCGGIVKPDVVMFGESVPRDRVRSATAAVARADALLVVGSSLMVYSGFRFVRQASQAGKAVVIVNQGRTRADDIADFKIDADCATAICALLEPDGTRRVC